MDFAHEKGVPWFFAIVLSCKADILYICSVQVRTTFSTMTMWTIVTLPVLGAEVGKNNSSFRPCFHCPGLSTAFESQVVQKLLPLISHSPDLGRCPAQVSNSKTPLRF